MSKSPVPFFVGLVTGAIVGAAFSVAMAPRSGRETRAELSGAGESAVSTALSAPGALRSQLSDAVHSQVDRFNEAMAAARVAKEQAEQEVLGQVEQSIEEAHQTK